MMLLSWEGGKTVSKSVFRLMSLIFTFEIGSMYTWTGKSKGHGIKKKLANLSNLVSAIKGKK